MEHVQYALLFLVVAVIFNRFHELHALIQATYSYSFYMYL